MSSYRIIFGRRGDEIKIPIVDCPDCKGRGWVPCDDGPMDGWYAPQVYGEPYNDRADCERCGGSGSIDEDPWEDHEDASDH
jgi:hypothetical protein